MLAMGQTDILMKHQAMDDSQHTVDAIHGEQHNPTEITGLNDQPAYQEKKDEGNTHGPHITGKALRLLAEIEEAEDKHRANHRIDKVLFNKRHHLLIDVCQSSKYHQRVSPGYSIDAIHKVVGIDDARTDYQGDDYPPPGQGEQSPLVKHHNHSREVKQQPHLLRSGSDVVHKADERHQSQCQHKPRIFKSACQEISQSSEIENDSPAPKCYACMGTAFIGLVNDITPVSYFKIKKFCYKQQNQNYQIIHNRTSIYL